VNTIKLTLAAAALTSVTAIAMAQTTPATPAPAAPEANESAPRHGMRMGHRMARLDTNNDGAVSQDEFASATRMKEADANGDGEITQDELVALLQKRDYERRAQHMTRRLDIDGDGKVTVAEIELQRGKMFALMDRNNDGKLEGRELRRGQMGNRDGRGHRGNWERGEGKRGGDWRRGHGRHHDRGFENQSDDRDESENMDL